MKLKYNPKQTFLLRLIFFHLLYNSPQNIILEAKVVVLDILKPWDLVFFFCDNSWTRGTEMD